MFGFQNMTVIVHAVPFIVVLQVTEYCSKNTSGDGGLNISMPSLCVKMSVSGRGDIR